MMPAAIGKAGAAKRRKFPQHLAGKCREPIVDAPPEFAIDYA
jgi:hypothetical protein